MCIEDALRQWTRRHIGRIEVGSYMEASMVWARRGRVYQCSQVGQFVAGEHRTSYDRHGHVGLEGRNQT